MQHEYVRGVVYNTPEGGMGHFVVFWMILDVETASVLLQFLPISCTTFRVLWTWSVYNIAP